MQAGDHLYVHKSLFGTGGRHYSHHGLYIGNRRVIHYAGYANGFSAGGSRRVEMVSLEAFSTGQPVRIRTHAKRPFDHAEAVRRAFSRLGEDKYNLLWRNCEHFATWCCTGEERSEQVRKAVEKVVQVSANGVLLKAVTSASGRQALARGVAAVGSTPALGYAALGIGLGLFCYRLWEDSDCASPHGKAPVC